MSRAESSTNGPTADHRIPRPCDGREPRPASAPAVDPIAVDAAEVGRLLGWTARTTYRLEAAGKLPRSIKIMGNRRWLLAELRAWAAAGAPDRATWDRMRQMQES